MTTYNRAVYQIEVLSEEPFEDGSPVTLDTLAFAISEGDCSGVLTLVSNEEVTRERMAELLEAQGSDPSFLLGDDDGVDDEDAPALTWASCGACGQAIYRSEYGDWIDTTGGEVCVDCQDAATAVHAP